MIGGFWLFLAVWPSVRAGTSIDATNRYAYAGNLGWINWVADTNNGAVIGEYVCSGNLYSENTGWINLGSGSPANKIQYQNNSGTDYGVNQDGLGNLTGDAWSANIGWVVFEQTYGQPKVNLYNGQLSGSIWSANCGWISLSNAWAYVQADSIQQGALAPNGLPVAWLLQNFGTTNVNAGADPTGKGYPIQQDYLTGTDPNNFNSVFRITYFSRNPATLNTTLDWNSVSTHFYAIQTNSALAPGVWADRVAFPYLGASSGAWYDSTPTNNFYRLRVFRPLMPLAP
jgi:hypothetical protein